MASVQDAHSRHDRDAWETAVKRILGEIPDRVASDDAERMAAALRSVASLMGRLSPARRADEQKAA